MESFSSPFLYFVWVSWPGFILAMAVYCVTFFSTHWKVYVEKW